MKLTLLALFLYTGLNSIGQNNTISNCSGEAYHQFDFWLGNWNVYDTTGKMVGQNDIVALQGNCILQENWTSSNRQFTGSSYNYYNSSDSTWNQLWIDNSGGSLELKGEFVNGTMKLRGELIAGSKVPFYRNEINWTLNSDGSVTQEWFTLDEHDTVLSTVFLGIYLLVEEQ
jgi:hypothetical protein